MGVTTAGKKDAIKYNVYVSGAWSSDDIAALKLMCAHFLNGYTQGMEKAKELILGTGIGEVKL